MLPGSKWTKVIKSAIISVSHTSLYLNGDMFLFQVFVIAVFNFLLIYYVLTKFDLSDDKKFAPTFLTRLPKNSPQKEADSNPSEHSETLIDSMKNILFCQSRKKIHNVISDQEPDETLSQEVRSRLLDSSEIELVVTDPNKPPFLGLQNPKLESLKQFEALMKTRVQLLRRGCSDKPSLGSQASINYGYLYVLKVCSGHSGGLWTDSNINPQPTQALLNSQVLC